MTKGRPPSKRRQPDPLTDKLRDPKFIEGVKQSLASNLSQTERTIKEAAAMVENEPERVRRRTGVDYVAEKGDVLRHAVYEQTYGTNMPIGVQVADSAGHMSYSPIDKTADCPLNYLFGRVEKKNRIDSIQYAAGVRYREDVLSLSRVGSNTASTIEHIIMAPELTPEDRWKKLHGVQFMKAGDDTTSIADPTMAILSAVYRVRRINDRLELWELQMLRELIVIERPVGKIAAGWGIAPEAASVLCRLALWKLARIMENSDKEFQAWLTIERQRTSEAKV